MLEKDSSWKPVNLLEILENNKKNADYLLSTYLLTPWSRVLEKLTGLQLVKKIPAFYGTRRFITAFTSARHLSLSWNRSIQSIPPNHPSWRSILILSSHLRLDLPSSHRRRMQILTCFRYLAVLVCAGLMYVLPQEDYNETEGFRQLFIVTPCINDVKHFITQLMHTTWKRRVIKTY